MVVRSTSPQFADDVRRLLRSFHSGSRNGVTPDVTLSFIVNDSPQNRLIRPFHFVYSGYSRVERTTNYWQLFRTLEIHLLKSIGERVKRALLVHAGAVSYRGKGIMLPGQSGSGKSSLALGLLQRGYNYLSDELAPIDVKSGRLLPFPKPLSIKDTSVFPGLVDPDRIWHGPAVSEAESVWYVQPEEVKRGNISKPVPVRYIFFPTYAAGRKPELYQLEKDEAARKLLECTANFHRFGATGLRVISRLVQDADCFELATGDLDETVALISNTLGK